jgi:hypothetical protein
MDLKAPEIIALGIVEKVYLPLGVDRSDVLMKDIEDAIRVERDLLTARIQVADLHEGDVVFITCPERLSETIGGIVRSGEGGNG